MSRNDILKKFPNYVPVDKLPKEAKEEKKLVYRVCKWGIIERKAFYSNYEEYIFLGIKIKDFDKKLDDIFFHSVSTFERKKEIMRIFNLISQNYPEPIIAQGYTDPGCGLCLTGKNTHTHWWIYEGAKPHIGFEQVNDNE